jgi:serine/threonine protein kinase
MAQFNKRFAASSFKDFTEVSEIYRSSSGTVHKGKFKFDGKFYVLKERRTSELAGIKSKINRRGNMMHEVNLLQQLNHPNVVRCEGWFWEGELSRVYFYPGTVTT